MKIQIRNRNVKVSNLLRAHVERRLGFALGRFGDHISRVIVRFSSSGTRALDDEKLCEIDVGLRARNIRAEDNDADLFAAVSHASGRVSRSVARELARELAWDDAVTRPRVQGTPRK